MASFKMIWCYEIKLMKVIHLGFPIAQFKVYFRSSTINKTLAWLISVYTKCFRNWAKWIHQVNCQYGIVLMNRIAWSGVYIYIFQRQRVVDWQSLSSSADWRSRALSVFIYICTYIFVVYTRLCRVPNIWDNIVSEEAFLNGMKRV